MSGMFGLVRRATPPMPRLVLGRIVRGLRESYADLADPWRRRSLLQLRTLHDRHCGRRCFILGNGPSLRRTDLSRLREEFTIGLNRVYLLFGEVGFPTSYYVAMNRLVIEQCAAEIRAVPAPKFIAWHSRDLIAPTADMIFLNSLPYPCFSTDLTNGVWEGSTVTYAALQVAFYLGFAEVILVGVDHNFATIGPPHSMVVSEGDDVNHFSPDYFGRGFRWNLPDLETSELAYRIARFQFEAAGRHVADATIGGHLTVFPKVDYDETAPRT